MGEAGNTMDEIVLSVKRVASIIGEIAEAGHEQQAGLDQINSAISDIDGAMQQNAALVEEAAAASASLQEQAASLAGVVSVFQLTRIGA